MGVFPLIFVPASMDLTNKEGYIVVVYSWLLSCLLGMLPYVMWGGEFSLTNAWFESVSGFTTTGATILTNVEALPNGLHFWRASTHWIGGVGIVLFALVILPAVFKVKVSAYKFELSSFAMDNFKYRAKKLMAVVLIVYVGLTFAQTIIMWLLGMNFFDAVCHSFSTTATGGFSTKNLSIAYYNSFPIELVVMIFMVLSGMHFGLLFSALRSDFRILYRSENVRFYILSMMVGIVIIAISLYGENYKTWSDCFRYASFQLIALASTTGFATAASEVWPPVAILIIVYFTIQTACSGSTTGGIKVDRMLIFYKNIKRTIYKVMHPNAIIPVKIDGVAIKDEVVEATSSFIAIYVLILFISTVITSALGLDLLSSFTGAVACLGNAGPGFGIVSSLGNYSSVPEIAKWIFSFDMLLGRLEIYGLVMIFVVRSWK
jgi:trk system potassium uptake protein TrkH